MKKLLLLSAILIGAASASQAAVHLQFGLPVPAHVSIRPPICPPVVVRPPLCPPPIYYHRPPYHHHQQHHGRWGHRPSYGWPHRDHHYDRGNGYGRGNDHHRRDQDRDGHRRW